MRSESKMIMLKVFQDAKEGSHNPKTKSISSAYSL